MLVVLSAFMVIALAAIAAPLAKDIGLVDVPDHRKHHSGSIPLIGGLVATVTAVLVILLFVIPPSSMLVILLCCGGLVVTGVLDDRFDISAKARLFLQALAAVILFYSAGIGLNELGNLFNYGSVELDIFALPVTVIAVVALINCYNMIDGIDGLCAGLVLITLLACSFLTDQSTPSHIVASLKVVCGCLIGFLILNLNLFPRSLPKIFMGDAGSMVLGFIVSAYMIRLGRVEVTPVEFGGAHGDILQMKGVFNPVIALWLVALPMVDMVVTLARRVHAGKSPLDPDRTHIHHILLDLGINSRLALVVLLATQLVLCCTGILLHVFGVADYFTFTLFICFVLSYWLVTNMLLANSSVNDRDNAGSVSSHNTRR